MSILRCFYRLFQEWIAFKAKFSPDMSKCRQNTPWKIPSRAFSLVGKLKWRNNTINKWKLHIGLINPGFTNTPFLHFKVTQRIWLISFCSLAPPTVVECNTTIIKTNLCVSPAHIQPYTWTCWYVEEATKMPSKAHKNVKWQTKHCGSGLETKVVNCIVWVHGIFWLISKRFKQSQQS